MKHETRIVIQYEENTAKYKNRYIQQNPYMPEDRHYIALTKEILDNIDFFTCHNICTTETKYTNATDLTCRPTDFIDFLEKLKTFTTFKKEFKEVNCYEKNLLKEPKKEYISIDLRKDGFSYWCDITIYGNISKEIQRLLYVKHSQ